MSTPTPIPGAQKRVVKKPAFRSIIEMLEHLRNIQREGECYVVFSPEAIDAQIQQLKIYSAGK